jgi:hypothetical protein
MEMQKQEEKTQPLTSSFYPQFPPSPSKAAELVAEKRKR